MGSSLGNHARASILIVPAYTRHGKVEAALVTAFRHQVDGVAGAVEPIYTTPAAGICVKHFTLVIPAEHADADLVRTVFGFSGGKPFRMRNDFWPCGLLLSAMMILRVFQKAINKVRHPLIRFAMPAPVPAIHVLKRLRRWSGSERGGLVDRREID